MDYDTNNRKKYTDLPLVPDIKIERRDIFRLQTEEQIRAAAAKTYDDDKLTASGDSMRMSSMKGNIQEDANGSLKMDAFGFSGAFSFYIVYLDEPETLEVNYSADLKQGRVKLVQIGPDNKVKTLFEGSHEGVVTTTPPKGRSAFKLVMDKGMLENVDISFGILEKNSVLASFKSEGSEESMSLLQEVLQNGEVQFDKLLKYASRIDSEAVSYCVIC